MKINLPQILNTAAGGKIPYNYVVGGKASTSGIPVEVTVKLDPDLKKTILKGCAFLALGIIGGAAINKLVR
jgi:hypothetical protein